MSCYIRADTHLQTARAWIATDEMFDGFVLFYVLCLTDYLWLCSKSCIFKRSEYLVFYFAVRQRHVLPMFFHRQTDVLDGVCLHKVKERGSS